MYEYRGILLYHICNLRTHQRTLELIYLGSSSSLAARSTSKGQEVSEVQSSVASSINKACVPLTYSFVSYNRTH